MILHFNSGQSNDLFQYARKICESNQCENCPIAGSQPLQTELGTLICETGRDRKPKGQTNEQGTGSEDNKTNQGRDDESKK